MLCPKCRFEQDDAAAECARCGVIFARLPPRAPEPEPTFPEELGEPAETCYNPEETLYTPPPADAVPEPPPTRGEILRALLFTWESEPSRAALIGRTVLFAFLVLWGCRFLASTIASNYVGESFMHLINLPFHEAGHVIFGFFGDFIRALGGTLGQLLIPAICLGTFLLKTRDPFAASVALWWLGESVMDVGPYMADARAGQLLLLGGVTARDVPGYHDWENIFIALDWMAYDRTLAAITFNVGRLLILASFVWGGTVLWRQWRAGR